MALRWRVVYAFISSGFLYVSSAGPCVAKVSRHDTVIMKNGDRLTGEVKRLEQGVLYIQTDYFSGSVGVDWLQVDKVESKATFQIVLSDGKRLTGSISKVEAAAAPGKDLIVRAEGVEVPLPGPDVVEIQSQKQTFWRQLKGSIDLGYNYTSGNSQSSLSSSASAEYPTAHWAAGASYTASFSGQSGGTTTNLFEVQAFGERFLSSNSYLVGLSDFLHSSQQDLVLRTTLGAAYGRYLVRTNQNYLRWLAGADYTRASYQSGLAQPIQQNAELLLGGEYQPNDILTIKLSNNFHLNFSFWDNFDSRPPLNAQKNAQGISTGLGWTF